MGARKTLAPSKNNMFPCVLCHSPYFLMCLKHHHKMAKKKNEDVACLFKQRISLSFFRLPWGFILTWLLHSNHHVCLINCLRDTPTLQLTCTLLSHPVYSPLCPIQQAAQSAIFCGLKQDSDTCCLTEESSKS